jgi:hypothetical protein
MTKVDLLIELFDTPDNVFQVAGLHGVDVRSFFKLTESEFTELVNLVPWREFEVTDLGSLLVD